MSITVITNNVPRDILDAHELTPAERERFGYIDWHAFEAGEAGVAFVRYKGELLDLGEFQATPVGSSGNEWMSEWRGWGGYINDSYFSGILVKYVGDEFDQVVMGRYYS
jgi:hypothetical protein